MSKPKLLLLCLSSAAAALTATSSSPNSPKQLRGGVAASVESGRGLGCYHEVVFTMRCGDGTRVDIELVNDGDCENTTGRASNYLDKYCGVHGGTASASCELICPVGQVIPMTTVDSIDCTWAPGLMPYSCPGTTFDRGFTESYSCDNGQDVCCTLSSIDTVYLDRLAATCSRDFNKAEEEVGRGELLASEEEQGNLVGVE
mmetsp:Transcript_16720/g.36889  ORF Transcript_16720/g.36889 Transcript_16720/m.36889 type:complete len:201 (-) Transcript_16720:110-712(-)